MKEKLTVVITNRNTKKYLELAIKSLKKNDQGTDFELLVMDDNSTDGSKEWGKKNSNKYGFTFWTHEGDKRLGVVGMNETAISMAKTDIIFLMHSDMYAGKYCLNNLMTRLEKGKILCSTRIEPPIYKHEDCRIQKPFGTTSEDFKEKEFNEYVDLLLEINSDRITDGMFAPTMFYKEDWSGYDKNFAPQSREDSDLFYTWKTEGKEFIQVWDSIVYHFSGKGSRRKDDSTKDTDEWKKTEDRNRKEFIRKWGTSPIHTKYLNPIIAPQIKLSCVTLLGNEEDLIYNFLDFIEPFFNEIILVNNGTDNSIQEVERYVSDMCKESNIVNETKIKIVNIKQEKKDFAELRNRGNALATGDWIMEMDVDETYDIHFLNTLRFLAEKGDEQNVKIFGFHRINTLDGKPTGVYPDTQFRFHKPGIKWVGKVHEVLEPINVLAVNKSKDPSVQVVEEMLIGHHKTSKRQSRQNKLYRDLVGMNIKNVIIDSVIYTNEGITHHAREEAKEFLKRGWNIQLLDFYKTTKFGDEFKKMYGPVDVSKKTYFTYVNQNPLRWERSLDLENFVGYFAFEGLVPDRLVPIMNDKRVKEIWTPSKFCKDCFIDSGVKKEIKVIPHGIDIDTWKYKEKKKKDVFTFLGAGTWHNDRKGLDLLVKAFNEEFGKDERVRLVLKLSDIYNPGDNVDEKISKIIKLKGNTNIEAIEEILEEKELVDLFHEADCFVSPHRAEGFGIFILQAMASGTPVIATDWSGNVDFSKGRTLELPAKEDYMPTGDLMYQNATWKNPDFESLKKFMRQVFEGKYPHNTKDVSKYVLENYNWSKVVDKMEEEVGKF